MPQQTPDVQDGGYRQRRRGVRVNSRVPVAVEWTQPDGTAQRQQAYTCVIGPYGCLIVLPQELKLEQRIQITNLINQNKVDAVVVWKGNHRPEGWELGIELQNPQMDFWGLELM
ncbi:MAG: PilZ domain-containing protein [Firmicutes bacterium]|nr:PilZ domain-containing protein [Bacillota bacterium]